MIVQHPRGYCLIGDVLKTETHLRAEERLAIIDWLEGHGINHQVVPLRTTIVTDPVACTVTYWRFEMDDRGRPVVEFASDGTPLGLKRVREVQQGETPPLAWPETLESCPLMPPHES